MNLTVALCGMCCLRLCFSQKFCSFALNIFLLLRRALMVIYNESHLFYLIFFIISMLCYCDKFLFYMLRSYMSIMCLSFDLAQLFVQMKTGYVALVLCLNISVDPPDVIKISPCARMECWIGAL